MSRRKVSFGVVALAAVTLALGGLASPAQSAVISFNPTGGGPAGAIPINGLDWAVGNALAQNAVPTVVGATFQLYYQSTLADLVGTNGQPITPPGLNSTYQITAVGSLTEQVVAVQTSPVTTTTFRLAPVQNPNSFFEIWYNTNPATFANPFLGTGFNNGTRIMTATPNPSLPSGGSFTFTSSTLSPFDQLNSSHYPGIQSVNGIGSSLFGFNVTSQDSGFFITPLVASETDFNTSTSAPFTVVEPSQKFVGSPGGGAPSITPNIGAINGVSGPDFQFQADANQSFIVPEPTSMALLGLGLAAGLLGRGLIRPQRKA